MKTSHVGVEKGRKRPEKLGEGGGGEEEGVLRKALDKMPIHITVH